MNGSPFCDRIRGISRNLQANQELPMSQGDSLPTFVRSAEPNSVSLGHVDVSFPTSVGLSL